MFKEKEILEAAKKREKIIVYPEAGFSETIVMAAKTVHEKKVAKVILLGDESALVLRYKKDIKGMTIINPKTSDLKNELAEALFELRKAKGLTKEQAEELVQNPIYFGVMLVKQGFADGMVGGAETATKDILRPALQIIKAKKAGGIVSSCFVMFGKNKMLGADQTMMLADCGLNVNPTEDELVQIAEQTVETGRKIAGLEPKVAFLSYSTKGSANDESLESIRNACKKFKEQNPNVKADGEFQFDTALVPRVAAKKAPNSDLKGNANVLIYPDLTSGNIGYKTMQYFGDITAVGPIVQGLNKPINDLSRGCSEKDVVLATAITVMQCE